MSRRLNRVIYKGKNIARSILTELMDSFSYLLYISATPLSMRLIGECSQREISPLAVNMSLSRLYKKGFISKIRKGREIWISLVTDFWEAKDDYVAIKRKKYKRGWDKKWRLLIYDIPENKKFKRERLRFFINNLGFGRVQDSCWVSPYDYSKQIYEFSKEEKILDNICMYEGKFFVGKDINSLVNKVWGLKGLFNGYKILIDRCTQAIEFVKTKEVGLKDYYKVYHSLYKYYREILGTDPFLPAEFLKHNTRPKAEIVFDKLASLIVKELKLKI